MRWVPILKPRFIQIKNILFRNMSNEIKKTFRDASSDIQRDQLLIQQLKQNHGRKSEIRHQATDDTQQGVLSANVKMRCMLNGESDLNELAKQTMQAFHKPRFPSKNQNPNEKPNVDFDIRGGANTYYMCKFTDPTKNDWREVAIEDIAIKYDQSRRAIDISKQGVRAGGAGNGGLMRIGYDLSTLAGIGRQHARFSRTSFNQQSGYPPQLVFSGGQCGASGLNGQMH